MGELGLTYDYFLQMTWAEFRIRLHAYKRMNREKQMLTREVCYQIYVSNFHGKGKPISKEKYWSIDGVATKTTVVTDRMKERIRQAKEQYKRDKANKLNG